MSFHKVFTYSVASTTALKQFPTNGNGRTLTANVSTQWQYGRTDQQFKIIHQAGSKMRGTSFGLLCYYVCIKDHLRKILLTLNYMFGNAIYYVLTIK